MRMLRMSVLPGAVLVASLAWVVPASAGSSPGAAKEPLVGPSAIVLCSDVTPVLGEDASQSGPGFVIFNVDRGGRVHANVVLKDATPNTEYAVRLIQGDGGDCYTVDATITTNGQGNGSANVVEALVPGTTAIQVIVDTGSVFSTPTYRGAALYTLA